MAESDGHFEIKSEGDRSQAFLCTEMESFQLVEAEISNKLLIFSNLWLPIKGAEPLKPSVSPCFLKITTQQNSKIELNLVREPKLSKIKAKLSASLLKDHIEEEIDPRDSSLMKTKEALFEETPCSLYELDHALRILKVVEFSGYLRMLDIEYTHKIVSTIFTVCDELDLNLADGFPMNILIEGVQSLFPSEIVFQVMSLFFYASISTDEPVILYPNDDAVCQLYGEHILAVLASKFSLDDFMTIWSESVPTGMKTDLAKHLTGAGRAICKAVYSTGDFDPNAAKSIELLRSEDVLDDDYESRLQDLFTRKTFWTELEICSYMDHVIPLKNSSLPIFIPVSYGNQKLDFRDYSGRTENESESFKMPAVIGTILNKFCRFTTHPSLGRIYIIKHPHF
ncbi:Sister chromatid cohesion protein DCC1 [Cichlidogyrus casuarinus]|uniref:Sister chromatid cohesion protein DCC1 n=1 Tax=Cichlidogyrus casuarinus TaxID=1844966 RepID=A0ABD2QKG7_9PLAT